MGVETTAYSVPPKMMRKIRAANEVLDFVFGNSAEEKPEWKFDEMGFGKRFDENIYILREGGYQKTSKILNLEEYIYSDNESKFIEYDGYEVVIVTPSEVKTVAKELETVNFEKLKTECLEKGVTDYYGTIIRENEYDSYLSSIKQMKKFFQKNADAGNFVIFATA
jgi:Domain of unknown function (DUF1877)